MILRYYGHSLFTLALEDGTVVATDPYGDFHQYPRRILRADVVTVSHHHADHDSVGMVEGNPIVIDRPGLYTPGADLTVTGFMSFHDAKGGALRGNNVIFLLEAEGLRIVHLGDLGHVPTESQRLAIGSVDVLLIPVGGYYTIDAQAAVETMRILKPRVTIPMHYRTRFSEDMPIQTAEPFLRLVGEHAPVLPLCRLTQNDLSERPPVLVMELTP